MSDRLFIHISEETYREVRERVVVEKKEEVQLKGKSRSVIIYKVTGLRQ